MKPMDRCVIKTGKVIIRERSLSGAWNDYTWETDPELAQLDAVPMITITFPDYLSDYIRDLRTPHPTSRRFALDTVEGRHIGNCSFYNINEARGEAEIGIMIGDRRYWDKGYGTDAITALVSYIFSQTNLNRLHLKTLESNIRAQSCFQKCGFTPYGYLTRDGYNFILMEIYRDQWQKQQTKPKAQSETN